MAIAKELFHAYQNNELPRDGGFIVSSFFDANTTYTRYEIISYANVKSIFANDEGLTFQADGKKIFVLVEPTNYPNKHTEPAYRDDAHRIPYRSKELDIHVTRRQDRIMVGKEPVITYTSFTVLKSEGSNYSYIFFHTPELRQNISNFIKEALRKEARVPSSDAAKTSEMIMKVFEELLTGTYA